MSDIDWKNLKMEPYIPLQRYSRVVASEGAVLIKNDGLLPITEGRCISVFGRMQVDYYISGLGSGGLVNTPYIVNILDGIENNPKLKLNTELADTYRMWTKENPTTVDYQWTPGVWTKPEMPVGDELVEAARKVSDIAVVVIGRISGETRDNGAKKGCWYLSDEEENLLKAVSEYFENIVVLLNVGTVISMDWIERYHIKSVVYLWMGGQEGGNAAADILCGDVTPCGKLADTIAKDISLYPNTGNFGGAEKNLYQEDIYVGYRYFETFAQEDVAYPFGYGLSYTDFVITTDNVKENPDQIIIDVSVKNVGNYTGKEVVQVYFEAPQGKLGKSTRELCAFAKTEELAIGEEQALNFVIEKNKMSAYDEENSAYVLENGEYHLYIGNNVRDAKRVYTISVAKTVIVEQLSEALAPVEKFEIMYPVEKNGKFEIGYKNVRNRTVDYDARIKSEMPVVISQTGDVGIKLIDVKNGKKSIEEFVAQLDDNTLMCLIKGEGMCSPKVRPGTAGAIGGTTQNLNAFGLPLAAATDGPSGIRMDNGDKATSIPCGTAIACTWDVSAAEKIYELLSMEMCMHHVDSLLGPGINIHRCPLGGRNFEYYSEDPFLTGKIAAAQVRGMARHGNSATIKHFMANSQEYQRSVAEAVMSERAVREIYLKGFEIAVKEGGAISIMTAYNPVNGIYCSENYELNTTILRNEWRYKGVVMTDWWPRNTKKADGTGSNLTQMVTAQNDLYMVSNDAANHPDDLAGALAEGKVTRGQLQRNAINILKFLMTTNSFDRFIEFGGRIEKSLAEEIDSLAIVEEILEVESDKVIDCRFAENGRYLLGIEYQSNESELVQMTMNVNLNGKNAGARTVNGTEGRTKTIYMDVAVARIDWPDLPPNNINIVYPKDIMKISKIIVMK